MRVVIVGGTGNISQSIVRLLLAKGDDVTCFNRGQSGDVPDGVRVIIGNRHDRAKFEATMQREKFDVAIDMICFDKDDAASDVCAFRDVQQFIQCSTVCTYGIQYDWMPVTEDHELRPYIPYGRKKAEADAVFLGAYYSDNFPVTIIKPSTTHGPKQGLNRQIAHDFSWIDRIRKNKAIFVSGNGDALHQFLHIDDAAPGFVGVIGKSKCIGQVYNLVDRGFTTWAAYHRTMMKIIGQEVELVGIPLADLMILGVPKTQICQDIFAHNSYFSSEKIMRDVPEFRPQHTLESAMRDILAALDAAGRIPNSETIDWENAIITAQHQVREVKI